MGLYRAIRLRSRRLLPRAVRQWAGAYLQSREADYRRIAQLPVAASGRSPDGMPYVQLQSGLVFYGYPPSDTQRFIYRHFTTSALRERLCEESFGVAYNIVKRYLGPASPADRLKQGKFYHLSRGEVVMEIGAYIGYYAMRAAELVGETGQVIAVEAIDENLRILRANVERNGFKNIVIVPKAAWNTSGKLTFFKPTGYRASVFRSVVEAQNTVEIPCDTVDAMLAELGVDHVSFVRIQVNGAEWEVLEGMSRTLDGNPKLLIAAIYEREGEPSWKRVVEVLRAKGYRTLVAGRGNVFAWKDNEVQEAAG